jgi:sugar lactone lactonase YvrE
MPRASPVPVLQAGDRLGESVLWSAREAALYWVDFYGPTLHRWEPATGARQDWTIAGASTVGSAVLAEDGRLLLAVENGIRLFDSKTGQQERFADPNGGRAGIGYNDAKADRQGRYWVGTYDAAETAPRGVLYRLDPDGAAHLADSGYVVCNGPAFSPNGRTLYFSDTVGRRLLAYALDPQSGRLGKPRLFAALPDGAGWPDGITVDREGYVWCAQYGGGCLLRFAPDGGLDRQVSFSIPSVTSCCFGGPDLDTLYVTTARQAADGAGEQPEAGALFAIRPGVQGIEEAPVRLGSRSRG